MYVLELYYNDGSRQFVGPYDSKNKAIVWGTKLKGAKGSMVINFEVHGMISP